MPPRLLRGLCQAFDSAETLMKDLNVDQLSHIDCRQDSQDISWGSALGGIGLLTKLAVFIATEDESRGEEDGILNDC